MKRQNKTGSVTMLTGNRRKPYLARTIEIQPDGKRKWVTVGTFETAEDAERELARRVVMPVSSSANVTLKELFAEWQKTPAYTALSRDTKNNYQAAFKVYMADYHGRKFADLKLMEFQSMIAKAEQMGRSRSTMEKIKLLAGLLGKYAFANDIVYKVYAEAVRLPKGKKKSNKEQAAQNFTDLEKKKLFDHDHIPEVDGILILIYTGMRIEEMLRLTRFDIDLDTMMITGGVKTESGEDRVIPIHSKIQKYIRARYEACKNYLFEYDREVGNKKNGTKRVERVRMTYKHYRDYVYDPLFAQLGMTLKTPHKTRHTWFTRMGEATTDRLAIAEIGGHADPAFSEKKYQHPDLERLRQAVESMD